MAQIRVCGHREVARWRADDGRTYVLTISRGSYRSPGSARLLYRPRRGAAFQITGRIAEPWLRDRQTIEGVGMLIRERHGGEFVRVVRSHEGGWRPVGATS